MNEGVKVGKGQNKQESNDGLFFHTSSFSYYYCFLFVYMQQVQQNGSLYIHVYFTKSGFNPDPKRKGQYRRLATVHATKSK